MLSKRKKGPLRLHVFVTLCLLPLSCFGADLTQIEQLAKAGDIPRALAEAERIVTSTPDDIEAQFLYARLLSFSGQTAEAIRVYKGIIASFPQRPEPYNNLAALYAQQGELEQARQVLEQAMDTDPAYQMVYTNLNKIYYSLAQDSYGKALRMGKDEQQVALGSLEKISPLGAPVVPKRLAGLSGAARLPAPQTLQRTGAVNRPQQEERIQAGQDAAVTVATTNATAEAEPLPGPVSPGVSARETASVVVTAPVQTEITASTDTSDERRALEDPAPYLHAEAQEQQNLKVSQRGAAADHASTLAEVSSSADEKLPAAPLAVKPSVAEQLPEDTGALEDPAPYLYAEEQKEIKSTLTAPLPAGSDVAPPGMAEERKIEPVKSLAADDQATNLTSTTRAAAEEAPEADAMLAQQVRNFLMSWAAAWSRQDVAVYLASYGEHFRVPGNMSRAAWEAQRHERLRRPRWIRVQLSEFKLHALRDDMVKVQLIQDYQSNRYRDQTRKEFLLLRTGQDWEIVMEQSLGIL